MKIITPGKLPEKVMYRAHCGNCGCVFEFSLREASHEYGFCGLSYVIPCPTPSCGTKCEVYSK